MEYQALIAVDRSENTCVVWLDEHTANHNSEIKGKIIRFLTCDEAAADRFVRQVQLDGSRPRISLGDDGIWLELELEAKSWRFVARELSKEPAVHSVQWESHLTEIGLTLAGVYKDEWYPSGTAVIVGPHLALTAKHVIEGYWQRFVKQSLDGVSGAFEGPFALIAAQSFRGQRLNMWSVTRVWTVPTSDLAFLYLQAMDVDSAFAWSMAELDALPPRVGTRVTAFGYRNSAVRVTGNVESPKIEWLEEPTKVVGQVFEDYPIRRDAVLLPCPSFGTTAQFFAGMSGGPVFNNRGRVCGIVSTGMETEGDTPGASFASSLWPAMATKISLPPDDPSARCFAVELTDRGMMRVQNRDKLVIQINDEGEPVAVALSSS